MSGIDIANFIAYETVPLSASTSASSVKFVLPGSWKDKGDCMVTNAGSNMAFVGFWSSQAPATMAQWGTTAQLPGTTGTLNATPIAPGVSTILNKNISGGNFGSDTCGAITLTGTTQLYFTSGKGS